MSDYELCLPWPPGVNHYHQPVKTRTGVRVIKAKAVKDYHRATTAMIRELQLHQEAIAEPVCVTVTYHPPSRRRYDCDNFMKPIGDAMVYGGMLEDDHWIHRLTLIKGDIVSDGMVVIQVRTIR